MELKACIGNLILMVSNKISQYYVSPSLYVYGYFEQEKTLKEKSVRGIIYVKKLWQVRFENLIVKEKNVYSLCYVKDAIFF